MNQQNADSLLNILVRFKRENIVVTKK